MMAKETSGLSLLTSREASVLDLCLFYCCYSWTLALFVFYCLFGDFPLSFSTFCSPVPKDRDKYYFKLRQGVHKKVSVTVQQMSNQELVIERWVLGCGHQRTEIHMFWHFTEPYLGLAFKDSIKMADDLQKNETESGIHVRVFSID